MYQLTLNRCKDRIIGILRFLIDQNAALFSTFRPSVPCLSQGRHHTYDDAHVTIIIQRSSYHDMCRPRHPRQRRHIHCLAFLFRNCIVYSLVVQKFPFVHMFCNYIIKHKCVLSQTALLSVLGGIDVCVGRVDCPSCRRFIIIYSTPTYNRINIKCKWETRKI